MTEPSKGDTEVHQRELAAYEKWCKKDHNARLTMLSSMHDNLISEFEEYPTVEKLWNALKINFGSISTTRLCGLTMKFNSYKMRSGHMMKQYLRVMSTMICKLKTAGTNLIDKQQVQAVIRSLPSS